MWCFWKVSVTGNLLRLGLSTLVVATLLMLVSLTVGILLYAFMSGYVGTRVSNDASPNLLVIEAVLPHGGRRPFGLDLILANHDARPATVGNASAFIISGSGRAYKTVLVLTRYPLTIPAGGVGRVILYPLEDVPPGKYYIRLVSAGGGDSVAPITLSRKILGSRVVIVSTGNGPSDKVRAEDSKCWYEAWVTYNSSTGSYKVYFNFTPKPGVTLHFWRAELLNVSNAHPMWVGDNPYNNTVGGLSNLTYPYYDYRYWTPVYPNDFPVKVVFTSSP